MCQPFTAPTGEICHGDDVIFTCITDTPVTLWTVTPGGDDGECIYSSTIQNTDTCGPERRFTSSRTEMSEDINNTSLSVVNITIDFNGMLVECANDTDHLIGSYNICIIGGMYICVTCIEF